MNAKSIVPWAALVIVLASAAAARFEVFPVVAAIGLLVGIWRWPNVALEVGVILDLLGAGVSDQRTHFLNLG